MLKIKELVGENNLVVELDDHATVEVQMFDGAMIFYPSRILRTSEGHMIYDMIKRFMQENRGKEHN